ncbi:ABC transporter substrate-binding protein [Bradyrhizobium sp. CCBAU 53380]|uniref:ABC transporter substrate-binding protein n=1 Tax=Bradyrhizobium sp. CCBAU 53380 TaxID=1325117 RepID=UPI00230367D9|nr:ABC transporter substrate-binding protein [Bradyrhizobium sp. CCBAU 53380]
MASLAMPGPAAAQQTVVKRIALVNVSAPTQSNMSEERSTYYKTFLSELRRLGHTEGQNLVVDRYSKEQLGAGPEALAVRVISSKPDVILLTDPSSPAFLRETKGVPVVTILNDPVAMGYAQSMARPGGNVTGVSVDAGGPSIHGKRIALLREVVPAMSKLGCISAGKGWDGAIGVAVRGAAQALGVAVFNVAVDYPGNGATYRNAILEAAREGADAIMVLDSPDTLVNRVPISEALAEVRIPAIQAFAPAVDAGGLMAYSFDLAELTRRMAATTDAILRGANPGEIPFYQVSKFELSINLKTAKALGLTIPPTLLATAHRVVE